MTTSDPSPLSQIELYLSGNLDDQGADELLAEFARNPDFAGRMLRVIHVDQLLRDHYGIEQAHKEEQENQPINADFNFESLVSMEKSAPLLEKPIIEQEFSSSVIGKATSSPSPKEKSRDTLFARWSIVALLLAFVFAIYSEWFPSKNFDDQSFTAVARIVESVEAEWEESSETYKKGQELEPSSVRLKSGIVKLEFQSGAEVLLEGPTVFLVRDKNGGFCQQGRLSAFVPPQAVGFEIASPLATVVDLGTKFSMTVSEGKSEVHVLSGKVEVKPPRKEKISLPEGLASLLDLRTEPKTVAADPKTFFSDVQLRQRKQEYVEKRHEVWEEQESRLESDPALVYRLEPDTVSSLRKSTGSRDDKKAVEFKRSQDRIDISLGREYRSVTLIASVRPDDMRNLANTLLMGNDFYSTPGTIHWQLNRFGIIQFHISDGRLATMFDTDPIVRREDYKTWMALAVVVDAEKKSITHYVDGQPVKTLAWDADIPIKLDRLALGNEWVGSRKSSNRYFHGAMEDFWIFNRSFSAQEISDFYNNNQ